MGNKLHRNNSSSNHIRTNLLYEDECIKVQFLENMIKLTIWNSDIYFNKIETNLNPKIVPQDNVIDLIVKNQLTLGKSKEELKMNLLQIILNVTKSIDVETTSFNEKYKLEIIQSITIIYNLIDL
jgi:hypothetical protein